jgi:hypothetical protein
MFFTLVLEQFGILAFKKTVQKYIADSGALESDTPCMTTLHSTLLADKIDTHYMLTLLKLEMNFILMSTLLTVERDTPSNPH